MASDAETPGDGTPQERRDPACPHRPYRVPKRWNDPGADPNTRATIERTIGFVAANLFALRDRRGWSQSQAACVIGIRRETITDIENRRRVPDIATVARMALAYGEQRVARIFEPPTIARAVRSSTPLSNGPDVQP